MRHYHGYGNKNPFQFESCKSYWHRTKNRFENLALSRGIYRSRRGILMGVCRGLAESFDLSVFWLRVITLMLFIFTGFWPVGVMYILAGLFLKMEPASPFRNEEDEEFYATYANSRQSAINRIKKKFDNLDRRIQRMEDTVTSREFDWR